MPEDTNILSGKTRHGLITRIALIIVAIEIAAFGTLGLLYVNRYSTSLDERIQSRLQLIGSMLANEELPINAISRKDVLASLIGAPYLDGFVIGAGGRVIVATQAEFLGNEATTLPKANLLADISSAATPRFIEATDSLTAVQLIRNTSGGAHLYTVMLTIDISEINAKKREVKSLGIGVSLLFILLTSAGIVLFTQRLITRRVNASLAAMRSIEEGHLDTRITITSPDEIGQLQAGINSVAAKLGALLDQERLYATAFSHSREASMICDQNERIIAVNPAFTELTGYAAEEALGNKPNMLSSGLTPPEIYRDMWRELELTGYWHGELIDRRKDGSTYPKWLSISTSRDDAGCVTHYIGLFTDITERKNAENRIQQLAHHDTLTGLFNRHSLQERLGQAVATSQRMHMPLAVMFIDMDRFKIINDTLGHHVGDQLLIEVGKRLRGSVRESDIVARLGGDEFVVVLTGMEVAFDVMPVSSKILAALAQPVKVEGHVLHSTPSIGISVFPGDGRDVDTLMKHADTAMYHAKEMGRNNIQFFTANMNAAAAERMRMEQDLRIAIAAGQLELYYQPQICTVSRKASGVEALVRWNHPQLGMISPLKFIPVAEESGLIEPLGSWVLEEACRQITAWRDAGLRGLRMAVNLSATQLRSELLVEQVRDAIARYDIKPGELELEVTESAAMSDPERAITLLQALRDLGVQIAIDDFGTGYSSLAYLKQLPVDYLKIDRSFVKDIEHNENDAAISASIMALAHSIGLKVVAEGVETAAQEEFLAAHHCDYLQGYYFSKPEKAARCQEILLSFGIKAMGH